MKRLIAIFMPFFLLMVLLMACSSEESNDSSGANNKDGEETYNDHEKNKNDNQDSKKSGISGKKYEVVGDDVFTDFVEERYDGLEIEFISAGYVSSIPDELQDELSRSTSDNEHLFLEVEITNTTDEPIFNYEFNLTSEEVEDPDDTDEFDQKYVDTSDSISLELHDDDEFDEQVDFLNEFKLLANVEHEYLPDESIRGLHVFSFPKEDISENIYIHTGTIKYEEMFELEPTEEEWKFEDVEYDADYEEYKDELNKYE